MRIRRFVSTSLCAALLAATIPVSSIDTAAGYWIVTYDAPPTVAQIEALAGIALGVHPYRHLPAAVVVAPTTEYALIANLPGVRGVYPNRVLPWTLNTSTRTIRADAVWADGYTGAGIGIAVVDAGVDGSHPDLCAAAQFCIGTPVKTVQNVKILGRQSLADPVVVLEDQISTDSTSGHGSHVAGIAAGFGTASQQPGKYRGVAHGARLIGLGTGEVAEVDTVLAGFDWVLANHNDPRYNIKVVNNSWGPGAGHPFDPEEPVQRGIAAMHDAGLAVVFGAGNAGPTTDTLNAFGVNPKALSVAASTKGSHIAVFSSRGVPGSWLWRPTVTAPGMFIISVRARTGFFADVADATGASPSEPILPPDDLSYAYASGTSMSAPHISGVVALMQEAAIRRLNRYLTPPEIRNALQNTAVSRDAARGPGGLPSYHGYTMGAGTADALAAVRGVVDGTALHAYDDGVIEDTRTFSGTVGPATFFALQSFETTYPVASGAISLDAMIDWQHAAPSPAAQDLDIDLFDPTGALNASTTFRCNAAEGPNQFSSFCTTIASERITVTAPMAGTWRALIHGTVSATETVTGMWSAVYPDGTLLPPPQTAATITVAGPATPNATGQTAALTASVRDAAGHPVANAPVTWTSSGVGRVTAGETITDARGIALGGARSDTPGSRTVTVASGSVSGRATVTWIGLAPPPPTPPQSTPGRASGGGHFNDPGKRTFGFYAEYTAQSSAPGGELSFDDKNGTKVKATGISALVISGNQATVTGSASVNGAGGYRFQVDVTDNGEPGRSDTFRLVVTNPADPAYRYETQGTLAGGNIQVVAH